MPRIPISRDQEEFAEATIRASGTLRRQANCILIDATAHGSRNTGPPIYLYLRYTIHVHAPTKNRLFISVYKHRYVRLRTPYLSNQLYKHPRAPTFKPPLSRLFLMLSIYSAPRVSLSTSFAS